MANGLPGVAALSTYGGIKSNGSPVEDPTVDEDAAHRNQCFADAAGMTQTACRAWCALVGHGTAPTDPASNVHGAVWGNDVEDKPVCARTSTGLYTITFPATITDELGVEQTVNLRHAWASVEGATLYFTTATVTAPNVVTLRVFNTSFALNDAVGVTFTVFAI